MRYLRAHAVELSIDPNRVGVWGFSAGGHLSAYLSTTHTTGDASAIDPLDRFSDRPDFAILSYGRLDLSSAVPRPAATKDSPGMEIVLARLTRTVQSGRAKLAAAPPPPPVEAAHAHVGSAAEEDGFFDQDVP